MPGAGSQPAGFWPAGMDAPTGAPSSGWSAPWRGLFLDPSTGRYGVRAGSVVLQELDPVDAKVAFIAAIERRSLAIAPDLGNTFRARMATATDDQRPTMAMLAANESYADMIAAGDILIESVTLDQPVPGAIAMIYQNLRAGQSDAPTSPT